MVHAKYAAASFGMVDQAVPAMNPPNAPGERRPGPLKMARLNIQRRPIDAAVIGASLALLVALPLGIFGGLKIGRAERTHFQQGLPARVEMAAYIGCTKEFNQKFVSEPANWERAKKCNRIARAVRDVVEAKTRIKGKTK